MKNKKVKSEHTKQNMAVVKKSLHLLEEEELTEEVNKYPVLYDKCQKGYIEKDALCDTSNEIAKKFKFWKMVRSYLPMYEHLFPRIPLNG